MIVHFTIGESEAAGLIHFSEELALNPSKRYIV